MPLVKHNNKNLMFISLNTVGYPRLSKKNNIIGITAKKFLNTVNCGVEYKFPKDLIITPYRSTKIIPSNIIIIAE